MTLTQYQFLVQEISFGKRLPNAVYVFWETGADFGKELRLLLATLAARHELGPQYNLIKFRTDELKISFLSYPTFMEEAHPALRHALTVDLATAKARHTDYANNHNPPILHRKETFLPPNHPRHPEFAALTRAEEAAGLYERTATIGFKLNWEQLLAAKELRIVGHTLEADNGGQTAKSEGAHHLASGVLLPSAEDEATIVVDRHKTAMTRYDLSKPVKTLLEYGMLRAGTTFFDYGCGQGSDVRGLTSLGHRAEGWDPVHRSEIAKREADVVNLGYVLNVIEDPAERVCEPFGGDALHQFEPHLFSRVACQAFPKSCQLGCIKRSNVWTAS
jgi:hypothetical protein